MTQLLARQEGTCPSGGHWYVCTKGPFRGCCSVDPCASGVCPDEGSNLISLTTKSTTARPTATTVTVTTTAAEETATLAATESASTSTDTSIAPSPTNISSPNSGHSRTGLVGGIVGGVSAALLVAGLTLYLVYCMRKRRNRRFTLLRWKNLYGREKSRYQQTVEANDMASHSQAHIHPCFRTKSHITAGPGYPANISRPVAIKSTPESSPSQATLHHPAPIHPVHLSSTQLISFNSTPSSGSSTSTPDTTPELFDTGFYRRRAELSESSSRELINLPLTQRQTQNHPTQAASTHPPGPIITLDGAVLTANFNRLTQDDSLPEISDHAMSFMQYESVLPVYRPEWRSSPEAASEERPGKP